MIFNEDLLQFIWEKKYFDTSNLLTVCGKKIHIKDTGTKNNDQGPDFLNARIFIENTEWAGNIELHIKTSEWILHKHQDDNNYRNIILHVVWENNLLSFQQSPVLELVNYISIDWLSRCQVLMNNNFNIPCISFAHQPPERRLFL